MSAPRWLPRLAIKWCPSTTALPRAQVPGGVEDCYAVIQQILTHCEEWYQVSANQVILIGDSAGATPVLRDQFPVPRPGRLYAGRPDPDPSCRLV